MSNKVIHKLNFFDICWFLEQQKIWESQIDNDQLPHALLLSGSAGIGKRSLAEWKIQKFLREPTSTEFPVHPTLDIVHADVHRVSPEDGKTSISVDQIRALIIELSKTSYLGIGKVAIIEPANLMTVNAANSLLKTLEEPSGNALIILIADRMQNLPATIRSRCQHLNLHKPPVIDAIQWLKRANDSISWDELPEYLVEYPLLAINKIDTLKKIVNFKQQFTDLLLKKESPIQLAAAWSKEEPDVVLDWLSHFVTALIHEAFESGKSSRGRGNIALLNKINKLNLFIFLDAIFKLRNQAQGSYNLQMAYESLLVDWSIGLEYCNQDQAKSNRLPSNFFQNIAR